MSRRRISIFESSARQKKKKKLNVLVVVIQSLVAANEYLCEQLGLE